MRTMAEMERFVPLVTTTWRELVQTNWREVWQTTRLLLVVWAFAVWVLLILLPGMLQIRDWDSATQHLPYIFMGLGLVGAVMAAHSLRDDGHLLWFLGVLLLLAGWI